MKPVVKEQRALHHTQKPRDLKFLFSVIRATDVPIRREAYMDIVRHAGGERTRQRRGGRGN